MKGIAPKSLQKNLHLCRAKLKPVLNAHQRDAQSPQLSQALELPLHRPAQAGKVAHQENVGLQLPGIGQELLPGRPTLGSETGDDQIAIDGDNVPTALSRVVTGPIP